MYTTQEVFDLSKAWIVKTPKGRTGTFLRDKLFVSILAVCDKQATPYETAAALTATSVNQLMRRAAGSEPLETNEIARVTATVLRRFEPLLAVRYAGMHPESFDTKKLARGLI